MEQLQNLRFLKISVLLLLVSIESYGQTWNELHSVSLKNTPTSYSIDIQGNIFLGFSDGRLAKFNTDGKLMENFSLSNNSSITLIDVQNNLKPFIFYFDNQQITILDRFSSVPKNYPLGNLGIQIGMMACPAPDGDFWVLENNPQRLKKINPLRKSTVIEIQLSIGDTVRRMQAFQNLLIIGDDLGLHVFDRFGGFLHSINIKKLLSFQLVNDQLLAFTDQSLLKIDPFKGEILSIDKKPTIQPMLKTQNRFVAFDNNQLTFYKFIDTD